MHTIEIEISEVDRQTAEEFFDTENCLICTSLKNMGYNADNCDVFGVRVEGQYYKFTEFQGSDALHADMWPFYNKYKYRPSVVGHKVVMTCADYTPPKTSDGQSNQPHQQPQDEHKFYAQAETRG